MDDIMWLEKWYTEQCNGEWERTWGLKIETLDNPGWVVTVDLANTCLEDLTVAMQMVDNGASDWLGYYVKEQKFTGFGDGRKLATLLSLFRRLAESGETVSVAST